MKNKFYSVLLFALILTCIQFNACKKNCDPNNPPAGTTNDLFNLDKQLFFPYKDLDTLRLIKNNTDTILFTGGKIETGYNTALNNEIDCPSLDKLQYMKLIFTNNLTGTILLYENTQPQVNGYFKNYSITFNDRTYGPTNAAIIGFYNDTTKVIYAGGIAYKGSYKMICTSNDNLYFSTGIGIIKIIYKGDTYDKLP
ncbi:MAG: hypothetical protein WCO28_13205 [Bacteroidota bacterium]